MRAPDEHMLFVSYRTCITPVAQPLVSRDAAPAPGLHLEAVGHQAQATEGDADVVRNICSTHIQRVNAQVGVQIILLVGKF